jgi:SCY1-like protein 1
LTNHRLVRDQANKTLDAYLHRVRKHGNTMADTVLPPPEAADTHQNAARIGTSTDTSWAGWAISSFTNKLTAARGDIQPTTNGKTPATTELVRSSSMPRSPRASAAERLRPPQSSLSVAAPPLARSSSDRPASAVGEPDPSNVDDWGVDAWGALDDEMEDKDDDTFFDAATSRGVSPCPDTTPPAPAVFDDGGEPDFAGWLAAQSKAKAKKPLPKGLSKATSYKDVSSRGVQGATKTGTNPLSTTQSKSKPPSKISMKPKDEAGDDGWGDAW